MAQTHINAYPNEIVHPTCAKCGVPMWLTRIEPYERGYEQRLFECQACGLGQTEIVKLG